MKFNLNLGRYFTALLLFTVALFFNQPAFAQPQNNPRIGQQFTYQVQSTNAAVVSTAVNEGGLNIGYHILSWASTGTVSTCTARLETTTGDPLTGTYAALGSTQTCTSSGQYIILAPPVVGLRINPLTMTGSGNVSFTYTGYQGLTASTPGVVYSTSPTATAASITATTMYTPTITGTYEFSTYLSQTVVGASCGANSTVQVALVYQDPNAAAAQTVNTALYTVTTNGTIGVVPWTSGRENVTIRVLAGTAIQFQTTYSLGSSCSPGPLVSVYPVLRAVIN